MRAAGEAKPENAHRMRIKLKETLDSGVISEIEYVRVACPESGKERDT